jgi:hypothetical protein
VAYLVLLSGNDDKVSLGEHGYRHPVQVLYDGSGKRPKGPSRDPGRIHFRFERHLGHKVGHKTVLSGQNCRRLGSIAKKTERGISLLRSHNPKVAGSNPAPATTNLT